MDAAHEARLDAAFSALADPTRRAILQRLALGESTVMELAKPFAMTQPAISRHLRVLEDAGFIRRRSDGTKRPCQIAPNVTGDIDRWLDMLRSVLATNYARLDAVLAAMPASDRIPAGERKDTPCPQ